MHYPPTPPEDNLARKLKWLMLFRLFFSVLLLGSSAILQYREKLSVFQPPAVILYGLIISIFVLSLVYGLLLPRVKNTEKFAMVQIIVDTMIVSMIIYVTGNFSSIFSFLYLMVIIYASIFLPRRSTLAVAALCSIQYGVMVDLEYFGLLAPLKADWIISAAQFSWVEIFYKMLIIIAACFVVGILSSSLSEQERKSKADLLAMAAHVKRVEKLAAMGEMAAGMAHEIKNPLASITGPIQLLREEIPYSPQREKLMQIVLREADRLGSLVNDYLLFARPLRGNIKTVEIEKAVRETVSLFERDTACCGRISIHVTCAGQLTIAIDPDHMRQILWNLLLNASEAIEGRGRIDIRAYPEGDHWVVVEVADDGVGIPGESLQQIFDPFYTTKPKGTGLGLSVVHKIVESYNARLDVASEPGSGTVFHLRIARGGAGAGTPAT